MSDATTAVPAAIASSSTTPNDSPSSDGKQATVAPRSRAVLLRRRSPARATRRAGRCGRAASRCLGPVADDPQHRRRGRGRANASSSTARPLRGSWRPTKTIAGAVDGPRLAPSANAATSTPLGRISHSVAERERDLALAPPPTPRCATASRSHHRPAARGRNVSYQPLRPVARRVERADRRDGRCRRARRGSGPATSGSCRCTTSGRNVRSASSVRRGDGASGGDRRDRAVARDTGVLGPTVVMPGSGGGPSHGATTRASTPSRAARGRARAPGPAPRRTATASTGTTA